MKKTQPSFLLKDMLLNKEKVRYLSNLIKNVYPDFLDYHFENEVLNKFPDLELKERIFHISDLLNKFLLEKLGNDFEKSVSVLIQSLPELEFNGDSDGNGDFIFAAYSEFILKNGCNKKYLKFSLKSLEKFTIYFSSEFVIRDFYNYFEDETFSWVLKLSRSKNFHHRRLASEGSRMKLPWAKKIKLNYKKTFHILDNLYLDKSRYVTRSVANHLNDISKVDGDFVLEILKKWKDNIKKKDYILNDLDYIISHSTRTLVKLGNKKTLEFLGFNFNPDVKIRNFYLKKDEVKIGEYLEFDFEIFLKKSENLIIDYKIYYPLKNGNIGSKVFKIKKGKFSENVKIYKKHLFKILTTRNTFLGNYSIELIINGKVFEKKDFKLV